MTPIASVIIPTAPDHQHIALEAVESAHQQTVPVEVIQIIDHRKQGAAATRNKAAKQAQSDFLVFLDADDLIEPDFVERCLQVYRRGGYVFSDWIEDGEVQRVEPCRVWHPLEVYHYITTLVPRVMFEQLGGFDESLPALEDVDFYLRARFAGWQAWHCERALWHYRRSKGLSNTNRKTQPQDTVKAVLENTRNQFRTRYEVEAKRMANCCGKAIVENKDEQPGDVLVEVLYAPMRQRGTASGRVYPRAGFGDLIKVDPRDAQAKPEWWKVVQDTVAISPDVQTVLKLARR